MNAILSGRTARALILDGESLKSLDLDEPSKIVPRRRSDLPYLFGEAADLRILENTTIESVERELRMDCHFTWALDLVLISLDSELEDDIREEALEELEELFAENSTVIRVENVLYSEPLPEDADLTSAFELCDYALNTVQGFLLRLEASQELIEKTYQAWESIPTKIFGNHENRKIFKHTAVKEGLFRDLVTLDPSESVSTFLLNAGLKEPVQRLLNHRQVLQAWTAPLDEVINQDAENVAAKLGCAEALKDDQGQFDTATMEALIRKYHRRLRLAVVRILCRTMSFGTADVEADYILQDVYLAVFRKGIKDAEESTFTYLMRKAHYAAIDCIRRRRTEVELNETLEAVGINLQEEFEKKDLLERVISKMSSEEQQILRFFNAGYSGEEMAAFLRISPSAARARLSLARARLAKQVKKEHPQS